VPGVDSVSGHCAHPLRQNSQGIAVLVRSGELACRTDWCTDCWAASSGDFEITLRIWGPFLPSEQRPDMLPIDLLDWLARQAD
jgi:hypothetical protein